MSEQPTRKAAQAPISAHPAFPAIVALWFAALLGIGSLVLPIALFENLSEATGLSSLAVAAQPPLGATARIMIALVAGGLGVFAGLAIARRVIAASEPRPTPRRATAMRSAKRPISAHEEFGEGGIDDDAADFTPRDALPGRRRALSVTDDSARSEFLDHAPLPGHDFLPPAHAGLDPQPLDEPLDLAEFDAEPVAIEEAAADAPVRRFDHHLPTAGAAFGTAALSGPPVPGAGFMRAAEPNRHAVAASQPPVVAEDQPMTAAETPDVVTEPADLFAPESRLDEPAIVDLVERFARALQQRREEVQLAVAAEADMVVDVTFAFPSKDASARAAEMPPPAPFAPPAIPPVPVVPMALRPLGFDDFGDGDDDDTPALGLPLAAARPFAAQATAAPSEPAPEPDEEPGESEESYSSLLAMKSPFGLPREAVRIDDESGPGGEPIEPVVVFPGQSARRASPASDGPARDAVAFSSTPLRPFDAPATRTEAAGRPASFAPPAKPADAGETERALREALEKLQKMSGVA